MSQALFSIYYVFLRNYKITLLPVQAIHVGSSSSWGQPPETSASVSKTQTASLEVYSLLLHDGFILAGIPQGRKRNILFDTSFDQMFPGSFNHAGLKSSHTRLLYHNTDDRGLK